LKVCSDNFWRGFIFVSVSNSDYVWHVKFTVSQFLFADHCEIVATITILNNIYTQNPISDPKTQNPISDPI